MKKVVERNRNKGYYRVLHVPLWIWVFFVLPGNLTFDLYAHGPDWRHGIWLSAVTLACAWRGYLGRLPGCETAPYITHWGVHQPNLWYRVVCYTAAWIVLLVPFTLNLVGLASAALSGLWKMQPLYQWFYYPMALAIITGAALDFVPRAKRSTLHEGAERAWFYVAIWTIVPTQAIGWAMWRLGRFFDLTTSQLDMLRLGSVLVAAGIFFGIGLIGRLPRTDRYYQAGQAAAAGV